MGADKLQAVHEALADVFNKSKLNATGTEASHAAFDHETLSEAFNKPHLNTANSEQSFARFDHAALTGIFCEPRTERPSPTSFDEAFAEMLSERPPLSGNIQSPRPGFDHQAFAEILNEPPPISTNTKPSQPSFDHQALAEMLTASRADPINPSSSPLGIHTESSSSSAPFSGQIEHEEPEAKAFTASPPTNAEGARPPRAKSLLAKLHHIFSTKEEPLLVNVAQDTLPPSLSGRPHTPVPMTKAISIPAEGALPRPADALLAHLPSLSFEHDPKSPHLYGQPGNEKPVVTSPTDSASAWLLQAASLPNEISSPISTNTESSPPAFERKSSTPTDAGRLGNVDQDVKPVAVAAPAEGENAGSQRERSLLVQPVSPSSNDIEPLPSMLGNGHSGPILSSRLALENVVPAEKPDLERAQPPLTELPPLISPATPQPLVLNTEPSPVLSGQPDNLAPAEEIVLAAAPADTESARSQLGMSLLAERPPLITTNTESPPPNCQTESSPPPLSGPVENTASAVSPVAPLTPTNVDNARPQRLRWLLAELAPRVSANPKPPLATSEKEPSRPASPTRLKILKATAMNASVAPQANSESAVMQPLEVKRLLSAPPPLDDTEPQPFIFENESSPISLSGQPDQAEPEAKVAATAEDAWPQLGMSLLVEPPPSRFFLERKPLPATLRELDPVGPAVDTVAAASLTHVVTAQQHANSLPQTDSPAPDSTNTKFPFPVFKQDSQPSSLSGQPDSAEPPVNSVGAADATDAEGARPQHIISLLAALRVLTAKPSPPIREKEASRSTLASQPDNVGLSVETIAHPTDAESASARQTKSLLTEMPALVSTDAKSSVPILEKERSRQPVADQPANEAPTKKAVAVASLADTESVVTRAQQAKSLLVELDLNTAIQLRWVMRDIRSRRTKFSPVSANDLSVLMDLGLVELRDGLPRLTGLGVLALD